MSSIGELQVDLRLASAKFEQGLKDVNQKLGNFGNEIDKVKNVALGLAAALSAGAFASWIKGSIDAADAATKTAQSIGVTVEALTGLQFAADLAGVNNQMLSNALRDLNKNMAGAYGGAKQQSEAFQALGIIVTDAEGNLKSADSVLLEIADRFASTQNGADKTALSLQLFGKAGREMIPLLNGGAQSINDLTARAEKLGVVVSSSTAAASERFNDNLTILQSVATGAANSLAAQLLPAMNDISDAMVMFAENSDAASGAAEVLGGGLKSLMTVGTIVADSFLVAGEVIGASAAAIAATARGEFAQAKAILNDQSLGQKLKADGDALETLWKGAAESAKESTAAAMEANAAERTRIATALKAAQAESARALETDKATAAIESTIAALRLESETIGMTTQQIALYKLALDGATQAQLDDVATSQFIIQSYNDRVSALDALIAAEDQYSQNKASAQSTIDTVSGGLSTQAESVEAQYAERLAAINNARTFELDTALSYDELELRAAMSREEQITAIEESEARKRIAIQDAVNQSRLNATATMFGNLAALMNTKSRKLFEIGKAAAIAETAINTGRAAMGAYAALSGIPIVGPALGAAAALAAVAAGAAQIQQINSQQFGGGASVSFSGGSPGVYTPPQPTVPYGSQTEKESSGKAVNLIFNGNINGFDIAGLAEQLGSYINQSDTIFIDNSSRTGLQFATAI
jgi:hypothetical protein